LGTIHTPKIAPARSLQLYSTAGAKPTFQLFGDVRTISGPPGVSRPLIGRGRLGVKPA
jgi:hypothetical protein